MIHWNSLTPPAAPFIASIFNYYLSENLEGYAEYDERTLELVKTIPGYLGNESMKHEGRGTFISYWRDMESVNVWAAHPVHIEAKRRGAQWYKYYHSMIAEVSRFHTHTIHENLDIITENMQKMYISITGLKPKSFWATLKFWRLAIPSFKQAQSAKGNLFCEVKSIQGYQCTLTAWESREVMLDFLRSGTHLKAMKSFHKIATGRTYGYVSTDLPSWEEAFELLNTSGKAYH